MDTNGKRYDSELLKIHPGRLGQCYRYSYGFTAYAGDGDHDGNWLDWAVVKLDTHAAAAGATSGTAKVWKERGVFTSEPVYVPRPRVDQSGDQCDAGGGEARLSKCANEASDGMEDDGVVLVQCYDSLRQDSFLLCLDARSMQEIARAYTGMTCPISFHGHWLPTGDA